MPNEPFHRPRNRFSTILHSPITIVRIVRLAFDRFGAYRGADAAAGTAFFTIFSLFPLLLLLIALGSFFLEIEEIYNYIVNFINLAIPVSPGIIIDNIEEVLELRGPVTIIGIVGFFWSASGVFTILSRNINLAFPDATPRGFIYGRLTGIVIMVSLIGLLALVSISLTALNLLIQLSEPLFGQDLLAEFPVGSILAHLLPLVLAFIIFLGLYRWIPNTIVPWTAAVWAALFAAIAWQAITIGFTFYLSSGLAAYRLVYGSLGTIVALLFWIYLNFMVIFMGAHLAAAIKHRGEINAGGG
jgi:membrane protein